MRAIATSWNELWIQHPKASRGCSHAVPGRPPGAHCLFVACHHTPCKILESVLQADMRCRQSNNVLRRLETHVRVLFRRFRTQCVASRTNLSGTRRHNLGTLTHHYAHVAVSIDGVEAVSAGPGMPQWLVRPQVAQCPSGNSGGNSAVPVGETATTLYSVSITSTSHFSLFVTCAGARITPNTCPGTPTAFQLAGQHAA